MLLTKLILPLLQQKYYGLAVLLEFIFTNVVNRFQITPPRSQVMLKLCGKIEGTSIYRVITLLYITTKNGFVINVAVRVLF